MAIQISATRPLDRNHTQVEVKDKIIPVRYFKVPNTNVDEFCKDYKTQERKNSIRSTIILLLGALGMSVATFPLWNKINNKAGRIATGAIASLVGVAAGVFADFKITQSKYNKLMEKHNTTEFFVEKKEFPTDRIKTTRK